MNCTPVAHSVQPLSTSLQKPHWAKKRLWATTCFALLSLISLAQVVVNKAYFHSFDRLLLVHAAYISKSPAKVGVTTTNEPKVIHWTGFQRFNEFIGNYFADSNQFCSAIDEVRANATDATLPVTINVSFSCDELFRNCLYGTGNIISAVYGIRLAAQVYPNVNFHFTCDDAEMAKDTLILPWLMGYFSPQDSHRLDNVSTTQTCSGYETNEIAYMYREMIFDFRKMAIGLVGIPSPDHPSAAFAEKYLWSKSEDGYVVPGSTLQLLNPQKHDKPVFPGVEIDDAVIHFRCGDLMDSDHQNFAFLRFNGYTKHISPEARSIGILTQPFEMGGQVREADVTQIIRDRCRSVVESFVDYIQVRYPNSRVSIRNDMNETISLVYSRMIMANETIAGVSTFGVFPVMSTFGRGYLRNAVRPGKYFPNKWTSNPPLDRLVDSLTIIEESDIIMPGDMKKMWEGPGEEAVIAWFRNEETPTVEVSQI